MLRDLKYFVVIGLIFDSYWNLIVLFFLFLEGWGGGSA